MKRADMKRSKARRLRDLVRRIRQADKDHLDTCLLDLRDCIQCMSAISRKGVSK